jgi:tetratricopeptide (TPR) repeat protein
MILITKFLQDRFILAAMFVAAFFLSACGGDSKEQQRLRKEAEDIVNEAYEVRDYQRIIELVDSLKQQGSIAEGNACYWLGYAYDRLMQKRMAELYWKKGISAVENSTEVEDVKVYAAIVQRLSGLLNVWGEYESAQAIVQPAIERMEKLKCDSLAIMPICLSMRAATRVVLASARLRPTNILHKVTVCISTLLSGIRNTCTIAMLS